MLVSQMAAQRLEPGGAVLELWAVGGFGQDEELGPGDARRERLGGCAERRDPARPPAPSVGQRISASRSATGAWSPSSGPSVAKASGSMASSFTATRPQ